jgi:tellurite resistance protein
MENTSRLKFFPVSFFAVPMGLTGFSIAVQRSEKLLGVPEGIGFLLSGGAAAVFCFLLVMFGLKIVRFTEEVLKDLRHPIKLSFFPAISISLLLLSSAFHSFYTDLSLIMLAIGAPLHLLFTLYVLSTWIGQSHFEIHHLNPSWFIPVVGNILVPIAALEHGYVDISWFYFSIGLVFWLVLLSILFNRIIFHNPLPEKLVPTFFILIAPPAVGFISYVKLTGGIDSFARILYYFALFTVLLLLALCRKFYGIRFYLSWWAYSFPVAAISIASMLMYSKTFNPFFMGASYIFLAAITLIIAVLVFKTVQSVIRRQICVED